MQARALLVLLFCTLLYSSTAYLIRLPQPVLRLKEHAAVREGLRNLAQVCLARGTHLVSANIAKCEAQHADDTELELLPRPTPTCSCADVFALERRIDRLEHVIEELMRALTTCDDMLLLEREGVKCFIAEEGLTKSRPVKLLRAHLKDIMQRHKV